MRIATRALSALAIVLLAACGEKSAPPPLPAPPAILTFEADKPRLNAGESTTLCWTTRDAESVELVDQFGDKVELTDPAAEGCVTVTPTQSTFYVLRASGPGGRDSAFVQVAVDEDLKEVFLVAVPPQITSGKSAELLWSAFNASAARIQSTNGEVVELDVSNAAGVLDVTPARTTGYTLVGTGATTGDLSTSIELKVSPVAKGFKANPAAAKVGEKMTFTWNTAGASSVVLTESRFGELHRVEGVNNAAEMDAGSFEWTVPETFPGGAQVLEGHPLRFTLTVAQGNPQVTLVRTLDSFVGEGPRIVTFTTPAAVTSGKSLTLGWTTINAERLQLFVNGALVYEPLPRDQGTVAEGDLILGTPEADATYELIAYGHGGTQVSQTRLVRVVSPPAITQFNVPQTITNAGDAANAEWTTQNASLVTLRVKQGPVLFTESDAAKVAQGSTLLYPGTRSTVVLEAWNDAGDVATESRIIEVAATPAVTAQPTPVTPDELVTVDWSFDPGTTTQVIGDPSQPALKNNPGLNFYDLDNHIGAKSLQFADVNDDVQRLALTVPFRFPFLGRTAEQFFVSTNGFIAFDPTSSRPTNEDLADATKALPAMVAPFWDDLYLGDDSDVFYMVEGTTFPRRLVVQWNKVHIDDSSELTFQVQLLETGELRFAYKTLSGLDSAGENATIGWRADEDLASAFSVDAAAVIPDDELVFFTNGAMSGQLGITPEVGGAFTLFGKLANGSYVAYPARVNVIVPGSVRINEMMPRGALGTADERWIEIANVSRNPVDISGTQLVSGATATSWTVPEGMEIPAGGLVLFGASADPLINGGAPVEFTWSGLTIDDQVDDTIDLLAVNPVASIGWAAGSLQSGVSLMAPGRAIGATAGAYSCGARTDTFGSNGAFGTPGLPNAECFPYALSEIAESFEDISGVGNGLFAWDTDEDYEHIDLSPAPFTYFGTQYSQLTVSVNGWAVVGTHSGSEWSNDTVPGTASPKGALAIFWDDLETAPAPDSQVYVAHLPAKGALGARWIVSWYRVSQLGDGDDLSFQIKLFDDGTVEYHYASMISGSSSNYGDGNSATIWVAAPDGSGALPIGIEQPVISSNIAFRFTPVTVPVP